MNKFINFFKKLSPNTIIAIVILVQVAMLVFLFTSNSIFSNSSSGNKNKSENTKKLDIDSTLHAVSNEISEAIDKEDQAPTPPKIKSQASANESSGNTTEVSGLPSRFIIPKLGINTSVEYVGLDEEGRMDVPKSFSTVGWYKLGYKIGDNGSAVISGHFDNYFGGPAVFWNIGKLSPGDAIEVIDTAGAKQTFIVYDKKTYAFDQFPLEEVFGKQGSPGLNLITCSGEWDKTSKNYSTRTVIYASKN